MRLEAGDTPSHVKNPDPNFLRRPDSGSRKLCGPLGIEPICEFCDKQASENSTNPTHARSGVKPSFLLIDDYIQLKIRILFFFD